MNRLNCVLVVDDDPISNFVTEKVLRGMGAASMITTATDGKRAFDFVKYQCVGEDDELATCPDLILLDINMPQMNGEEFLERYRAMDIKHKTIIIVLTSTALPWERKERLKDLHANGFLEKPLTTGKLADVLEEFFTLA